MIVILEGINRVGKTTYGNNLSLASGLPYLRIDRPQSHSDAMRDPLVTYQFIKAFKIRDMILDRFFISEYVYHDYPIEDYLKFDDLFSSLEDCILYYCEAPKEVVMKHWKDADLKFDYDKLKEKYEYYLTKTKIPFKRVKLQWYGEVK